MEKWVGGEEFLVSFRFVARGNWGPFAGFRHGNVTDDSLSFVGAKTAMEIEIWKMKCLGCYGNKLRRRQRDIDLNSERNIPILTPQNH